MIENITRGAPADRGRVHSMIDFKVATKSYLAVHSVLGHQQPRGPDLLFAQLLAPVLAELTKVLPHGSAEGLLVCLPGQTLFQFLNLNLK